MTTAQKFARTSARLSRAVHATPHGLVEAGIFAVALTTAEPTYRSLAVGACVSAVGELLRLAVAGYGVQGEVARLSGPYRSLRHPHLTGSALLFLGLCLASRSLYLMLVALPALTFAYWPVYQKAESRLAVSLGPWYPRYRAMVPALLPSWGFGRASWLQTVDAATGSAAPTRFAWEAAFLRGHHRELDALLAMAATAGCLYALCWPNLRPMLHLAFFLVLILSALGRFSYYALVKRSAPQRVGEPNSAKNVALS